MIMNYDLSASFHCSRNDVTVFGIVVHYSYERFVAGNERIREVFLHCCAKAYRFVSGHCARRYQVTLHFVENIFTPAQLIEIGICFTNHVLTREIQSARNGA